ncbi:MAG: signal peptidase I [Chlorobi bacterium]|nr:signal peptidase I [Chlorobiota bacterium]
MTLTQWIAFFLIMNVVHLLMYCCFYKRAGYPAWYALIPFYNAYILTKIINRPWWWFILLYIPGINILMAAVYWFQVLEVFGKNTLKDKILVILTGGLYLIYLNFFEARKLPYNPEHDDKETLLGSLVFAVIAATVVHIYGFQPFIIPTPSLEKSLLVGDFLFVSKLHYGPRVPMTTLSVPMVHDTVPVLKIKSYLNRPQLPYMRLPGFQKPKRFEIVVFNWPADTVEHFGVPPARKIRKPIDKKSHYVKRLVGLPGDTIEVREGVLYVNGKRARYPDRTHLQHFYAVEMKPGHTIGRRAYKYLKDRYDFDLRFAKSGRLNDSTYIINLTADAARYLATLPGVDTVYMYLDTIRSPHVFPGTGWWSMDDFGPLYIPKKGDTLVLNKRNYTLYKSLLREYETMASLKENRVEWKDGTAYINGKPVEKYVVKQDYYWMMGDNRNNSEDSRVWGFVPWTHIVGKPVFIWFSWDKNEGRPRWSRVFTTVHGKGERRSYLIPFLLMVALYWGWTRYRKKKRGEHAR